MSRIARRATLGAQVDQDPPKGGTKHICHLTAMPGRHYNQNGLNSADNNKGRNMVVAKLRRDWLINSGRYPYRSRLAIALSLLLGLVVSAAAYASAVGAVLGEASVDPSGAANYKIPLLVPKGTAGMQPDLALLYSSRAPNGQVGFGWSLTGLSAISRCPRTIAQDGVRGGVNFDANDRFCLDGQRLKLEGTGVYGGNNVYYRTEIESYQRVQSKGGSTASPSYFVVQDKAGLKRFYGRNGHSGSSDGYINVAGGSNSTLNGSARLWAISRIEDKHGNHIRYFYGENTTTGEYYPSSIAYYNNLGTQIGKVDFSYDQSRQDMAYGYGRDGTVTAMSLRLTKLTVYGRGSSAVREYRMSYSVSPHSKISRLASVTLCSGTLATDSCLAPIQMDWEDGQKSVHTQTTQLTWPNNVSNKYIDMNGDGRTDVVLHDDGYIKYKLGGTSTWVTNIFLSGSYKMQYALPIDYNRDGLQDLLIANTNGYWYLLRSTGTGFVVQGLSILHGNAYADSPALIDFDNDGHVDLLTKGNNKIKYVRSNGAAIGSHSGNRSVVTTGFTAHKDQVISPMEFDGQFGTELYVSMKGCSTSGSGGGGPGGGGGGGVMNSSAGPGGKFSGGGIGTFTSGSGSTQGVTSTVNCTATAGVLFWNGVSLEDIHGVPTEDTPVMIDINGDGLTDIGRQYEDSLDGYKTKWDVYLNKGGSFELKTVGFEDKDDTKFQIFDYNLDGKADILAAGQTYFEAIYERNGNILRETTNISRHQCGYVSSDVNGDSLSDIVYLSCGSSPNWNRWSHRGSKADLMTRVTDGLGKSVDFSYGALSDMRFEDRLYEGHLAGGADTSLANITSFRGPIMVVESVATDSGYLTSGVSSKVVTTYSYAGAKIDIDGRGFLGFHRIKTINSNSPVESLNFHSQTFPYTGMVTRAEQHVANVETQIVTAQQLQNYLGSCEAPGDAFDETCYEIAATTNDVTVTTPGPTYLISETTNTLLNHQLGSSQASHRYFPYVRTSLEKTYKFNSTEQIKTVTTTNTYSTWGNPTNILVETTNPAGGERHAVDTTNAYYNDTNNWCLARLTNATVVHTGYQYDAANPETTTETRESSFEYHGTSCQLTAETSEPNDATHRLRKDYGFDSFGNRVTVTETGGSGPTAVPSATTTSTYDSAGQYVLTTVNAAAHTTSASWDFDLGVKLTETDQNGYTTTYQFDEFGRQTRVTAPRTSVYSITTRSWCSQGGCKAPSSRSVYRVHTDNSDGSESWAEFDLMGREIMSYSRGFDGQLVMAQKRFDTLGREYAISRPYNEGEPNICWSFTEYDSLSRPVAQHAHSHDSQCLGADPLAPHADPSATYAQGATTQWEYDGLVTRVIDPQGRVLEKTHNIMGRVRSVQEWDNLTPISTSFDYDAVGNQSLVRPPDNAIVKVRFDKRGNREWMDDADMGVWTYVTDVRGNLRSQTDAKGQTVTLDYDVLSRLTSRIEAEGTTTWIYDTSISATYCNAEKGRLTRILGPNGYEQKFCYRHTPGYYGVLNSVSTLIDGKWNGVSYYYDSLGRPAVTIYPSTNQNTTAWEYRLAVYHQWNSYGHYLRAYENELQSDGTWVEGIEFYRVLAMDELGNVTHAKRGGIVNEYKSYDRATGVLDTLNAGSLASGNSTHGLQNLQFGWDLVGNLSERIDVKHAMAESFEYDTLYRLTGTNFYANQTNTIGPASANTDYAYHATGGFSAKGNYQNYTYSSSSPHAVATVSTAAGNRSYNYDLNGNVSTSSGGAANRIFTWSSFNKPIRIEKDSSTYSEFVYGPDRARIQQISQRGSSNEERTTYHSGLLDVTVTYNSSGVEISRENLSYVTLPSGGVVATVKSTGNSLWNGREIRLLLRDHQGSIVSAIDELGVEQEAYAYDPWGKRRSATTWANFGAGVFLTTAVMDRGYTGHEHLDHLGLIHMNGRVYDPELGRFISPDPNVQFPESTQGFNRYTYVGNNPMSYSDPSGFFLAFLNETTAQIAGAVLNIVLPGAGSALGAVFRAFIIGFVSSGGDIESMATSFVSGLIPLSGALGRIALAGAVAEARGGSFSDGVRGSLRSMALGAVRTQLINGVGTALSSQISHKSSSGTGDEAAKQSGVSSSSNENGASSSSMRQALPSITDAEDAPRARELWKDGKFRYELLQTANHTQENIEKASESGPWADDSNPDNWIAMGSVIRRTSWWQRGKYEHDDPSRLQASGAELQDPDSRITGRSGFGGRGYRISGNPTAIYVKYPASVTFDVNAVEDVRATFAVNLGSQFESTPIFLNSPATGLIVIEGNAGPYQVDPKKFE
ncbi:MAG: RHS repeat-associated core domain-containing protein [Pseudomonadota bacterium]